MSKTRHFTQYVALDAWAWNAMSLILDGVIRCNSPSWYVLFFQIYRLLTYLDIHYSIFLYFSSNGCWIKSWATFQNPNPAATRYLNTSAAPFWVRKTFLFHLLKIFFSHITSIFLPCRYFFDQNEAHFYLKSKTLPKSTIWRSKQVPVFIFFDKVQYLSISNSSA